MLRWGSLGLKGTELPDLSPFRVVVDAMRGIPAQLIDSGAFVSVQRPGEICFLYNLSHTAVSLVLYAVDKGLRGRNVLQSLLLILLRICSRSVRPIVTGCLVGYIISALVTLRKAE